MKQEMKFAVWTILVLICCIGIGSKKEVAGQSAKMMEPLPPVKFCFTCDSVPEGTIFCDDFESAAPLADRYFEYDDNDGDFVRVQKAGRNESAGMRVVWQKGESAAG